jgi:hypothetical protein
MGRGKQAWQQKQQTEGKGRPRKIEAGVENACLLLRAGFRYDFRAHHF